MIRVKVCGVTRPADAEVAAHLGASAIGVITWPESPRAVSLAQAAEIARALPPFVGIVGVFVDAAVDEMVRWSEEVPLVAVQLHGDEGADTAALSPRPVIKAVRVTERTAREVADAWPESVTLLVDADDRIRRGGTGQLADWAAAARIARCRRTLLAGGLSAVNVREAIRQVRPWGVDVSSGVEVSPGIKDRARMQAFFDAVGAAEAALAGETE